MPNVHFSDQEEDAFKKSGGNIFADGQYAARLKDVSIKLVGQERRKKLVLVYEIKHPENERGRCYSHFLPLDNANTYGFLKVLLGKFGIDTRELALRQIEPEIQKRKGSDVIFNLKTATAKDGKQYQNAELETVLVDDDTL